MKKKGKLKKAIKDFLNEEDTMPLWLSYLLCFFAGSGFAFWCYHLIGKIFGITWFFGKKPQF